MTEPPRSPQATRTEIDGVPAFVADMPDRAKAALVFRAGQSDETLPTRGLTHLVEHLALGEEARADVATGFVDLTATVVVVEGSAAEIARRLEAIAQRFAALPLERLDIERQVLLAEDETPPHPVADLFTWHFGARGPGLVTKRELGLRRANAEDVAAHAAAWFTKGNAALAMTQPLPDLRRLALPDGERRPLGEHARVRRYPLPCEVQHDGTRYTGLGAPVAGGDAVSVLRALLERIAWRVLRHERGLTYEVDCRAQPVGIDLRFVNLATDARAADAGQAIALMVDAIRAVARGEITDADLVGAKSDIARAMADEPIAPLIALARAELGVGRRRALAEALDSINAVTANDVATAAAELRDQLIATLPAGQSSGVLPRLVGGDARVVEGARLTLAQGAEDAALIVARDGVTAIAHDGSIATVHFQDCVAAIEDDTGTLTLIGPDDAHVFIDPAHTPDARTVISQALDAVDPSVVLSVRDRPPAPDAASRSTTATGSSTSQARITFNRGT